MTSPRFLSAVVGAALLVGVPYGWQLAQPPAAVGALPEESATAGRPDTATTGERVTPEAGPRGSPAQQPASVSAPPPAAPTPGVPAGVRIPAIDLDATVVAVGLEDDGSMEIPRDVTTVGWYEPGVRPGAQGTAVLAGHVDSRTQGRGAFFDLRHLEVDDVITVTAVNGTESTWQVTARRTYPKDQLPIAQLFTAAGDPRLVLITCGGAFDSEARTYADNVVVYATPAETS